MALQLVNHFQLNFIDLENVSINFGDLVLLTCHWDPIVSELIFLIGSSMVEMFDILHHTVAVDLTSHQ